MATFHVWCMSYKYPDIVLDINVFNLEKLGNISKVFQIFKVMPGF